MGKAAVATAGKEVDGFKGAKIIECDKVKGGKEMRKVVKELGGGSTVPSVWIGGEYVGGGEDMARLEREGVLKQMIRLAVDNMGKKKGGVAEVRGMAGGGVADGIMGGKGREVVTFGAGCFWGVELAFQRVAGVLETEVGYAGGKSKKTDYKAVCGGQTGHAEVVKVVYDPKVVGFEKLLEVWEERHDPTSLNKQGNDRGTQYRSALFYSTEEQKEKAMKWKEDRMAKGKNIVTEICELKNYSAAEDYHQHYLEKKGQSAEKGASSKIRCYG